MPWALALSGLLHGGLVALALAPRLAATAEPPLPAAAPDRWTESAVELFDPQAAEPSPAAAPADPGPEAPPEPPAQAADPAPPSGMAAFRPSERRSNSAADRPEKAADKPEKSAMAHAARSSLHEPADDKKAKPEPDAADPKPEPAKKRQDRRADKADGDKAEQGARRAADKGASAAPVSAAAPGQKAADSGGGSPSPPAGVGMAGPAAVRDLGLAFTRAIGPAGMPDKAWASLPLGSAGTLEVALDIDEEGKLRGFSPLTKSPPEHLVKLVKQVQGLLRSGFFAIKGPDPTAGKQVVRLSATLSDVPTDVAGGPSELTFTYDHGKGTSRFTQASGRRVEVRVELLRVEAAR